MAFTVTIDQEEIETAIQNHVRSKISIAEGQTVGIEMKAGRGDNGFSATIEIRDAVLTAKPVKHTVTPAQTQVASAEDKPADPAAAEQAEPNAVAEEVAEPTTNKNKLFGAATVGRSIP